MKESDQVAGEPTVREAGIVFVQIGLQTLQGAPVCPAGVLGQGRGGEIGDTLGRGGHRRIQSFEGVLFHFNIGTDIKQTGVCGWTGGHKISVSPPSGYIRQAQSSALAPVGSVEFTNSGNRKPALESAYRKGGWEQQTIGGATSTRRLDSRAHNLSIGTATETRSSRRIRTNSEQQGSSEGFTNRIVSFLIWPSRDTENNTGVLPGSRVTPRWNWIFLHQDLISSLRSRNPHVIAAFRPYRVPGLRTDSAWFQTPWRRRSRIV